MNGGLVREVEGVVRVERLERNPKSAGRREGGLHGGHESGYKTGELVTIDEDGIVVEVLSGEVLSDLSGVVEEECVVKDWTVICEEAGGEEGEEGRNNLA